MKQTTLLLLTLLLIPNLASAQGLQTFIVSVTKFLDTTVMPFLMLIAFLFFIINVVRFFVIGSSNEEGRENAKNLAIYGVSAFVLILIISGLINMIVAGLGFDRVHATDTISDYVKRRP